MPFEQSPAVAGWPARLALEFARRGERTVLAGRTHSGPLHIQKSLHPEGVGICHAVLVHPPAGIAGGDTLAIDVVAGAGAHALITTPGATKWYRSLRLPARQAVALELAAGSVVEWLPQESIVFDGANAHLSLAARLAGDAVLIGMETICLGRTAAGERFRSGFLSVLTDVARDGVPLWRERGEAHGGDPLLASPIGLAGEPVTGTLFAVALHVDDALVDACREEKPAVGRGALTRLPGVLLARYLGPACEPCRQWMFRLWSRLRPALTGHEAIRPRIWST
jgi:urease accessory protein